MIREIRLILATYALSWAASLLPDGHPAAGCISDAAETIRDEP